ncbi:hypothetical protein D3C72_2269830 [compost metagenome]
MATVLREVPAALTKVAAVEVEPAHLPVAQLGPPEVLPLEEPEAMALLGSVVDLQLDVLGVQELSVAEEQVETIHAAAEPAATVMIS